MLSSRINVFISSYPFLELLYKVRYSDCSRAVTNYVVLEAGETRIRCLNRVEEDVEITLVLKIKKVDGDSACMEVFLLTNLYLRVLVPRALS